MKETTQETKIEPYYGTRRSKNGIKKLRTKKKPVHGVLREWLLTWEGKGWSIQQGPDFELQKNL